MPFSPITVVTSQDTRCAPFVVLAYYPQNTNVPTSFARTTGGFAIPRMGEYGTF